MYLSTCEAVAQCVQSKQNLDECRDLFRNTIDLISQKLCYSSFKDVLRCNREFIDQKFTTDLTGYDAKSALRSCSKPTKVWQTCVVSHMKHMDELGDNRAAD